MLPMVHVKDVSTWSGLVHELAMVIANHLPEWKERAPEAISWTWKRWDEDGGIWALDSEMASDGVPALAFVFDIDTDDPEEALVKARIILRETPPTPDCVLQKWSNKPTP